MKVRAVDFDEHQLTRRDAGEETTTTTTSTKRPDATETHAPGDSSSRAPRKKGGRKEHKKHHKTSTTSRPTTSTTTTEKSDEHHSIEHNELYLNRLTRNLKALDKTIYRERLYIRAEQTWVYFIGLYHLGLKPKIGAERIEKWLEEHKKQKRGEIGDVEKREDGSGATAWKPTNSEGKAGHARDRTVDFYDEQFNFELGKLREMIADLNRLKKNPYELSFKRHELLWREFIGTFEIKIKPIIGRQKYDELLSHYEQMNP